MRWVTTPIKLDLSPSVNGSYDANCVLTGHAADIWLVGRGLLETSAGTVLVTAARKSEEKEDSAFPLTLKGFLMCFNQKQNALFSIAAPD